jgi:diketogulonate reductase-like aldo/keto reductase
MRVLENTFTLANGVTIPQLGFGTWQIPDGSAAYEAVRCAIDLGYRHIDTARAYGNERSVGRAVRDSGLDRSAVFVTSKLPAEVKDVPGARHAIESTLAALDVGPLDLYLIHAPWPWSEMGKDCRRENREVWKVMEEIHASGRARAVGVSNFSVADLESLLETAVLTPHVNQIKLHVGDTQDDVRAFCLARNILVEGYSPLATGRLIGNPAIAAIASRLAVSLPRMCIRYVLQKGALPLAKSVHPDSIAENADIDFTIGPEDMAALDALTPLDAAAR